MSNSKHDPSTPKKATDLSINSERLHQAKEPGMNLSQAHETRPEERILGNWRLNWQRENREAIVEYNNRIEAQGTFSDGLRVFLRL